MAKTTTFLSAVNQTLKRASVIQGSTAELTSFTGHANQTDIDLMLDSWNEVIADLYTLDVLKEEIAEGSFTISTSGTDSGREYSVPAGFIRMRGDPINQENSFILRHFDGGFDAMREQRMDPDDFTGQPSFWVISPVSDNIRIDTTPTSDENGDVYGYTYDQRVNLAATTDTFPIDDAVVDVLQNAVWQWWVLKRKSAADFNEALYSRSMVNATHMLRDGPPKRMYGAA